MADDPLARLEDDPVNNTVHHPYTAHCQGWDARVAGIPLTANPYDEASGWRWAWEAGWHEAGDDWHDGEEAPSPPSMNGTTRRVRRAQESETP